MSEEKKDTVVVNPNEGIDLLSFESMKERILTLSKPVQNVFMAHDEEFKATVKAEKTTVDYLFDLTAEGIRAHEALEFIESMFKEAGLWPLFLNPTTKLWTPVGKDKARKESLAGKVYARVRGLLNSQKLILDENDCIQFVERDGKYIIKNEKNTDEDGEYTLGQTKGGKPSIFDKAKAKTVASQTRTVNPAEEKKKQEEARKADPVTAEDARRAREKADHIGQAFGNVYKGVVARQKSFEMLRPELVQTDFGKELAELIDNFFEETQNNLFDLADTLGIKEKEGRFIVNL